MTIEKVEQESMHDGPRAVKDGREGLDRGLALGHVHKGVHANMVMEIVLTEVKTVIVPSQDGCASTW